MVLKMYSAFYLRRKLEFAALKAPKQKKIAEKKAG